MATLSNELKAVMVQDNFLDNPKNVLKEKCLVLQNFSYECERARHPEVHDPSEFTVACQGALPATGAERTS